MFQIFFHSRASIWIDGNIWGDNLGHFAAKSTTFWCFATTITGSQCFATKSTQSFTFREKKGEKALAQLKAALLHLSFDRSRKWLRESENLTHSIFITKGKLFEIIFRLEFFSGHWTSNTHNSLQWTFLTSQLRTNTFCIDTHVIWVIFYFYQMFASILGEDNTVIINTGPYYFIFWWNSAQGVFLRKVNNLLPWILGPPLPGFVILKGVWNPLWMWSSRGWCSDEPSYSSYLEAGYGEACLSVLCFQVWSIWQQILQYVADTVDVICIISFMRYGCILYSSNPTAFFLGNLVFESIASIIKLLDILQNGLQFFILWHSSHSFSHSECL